MKPGLGVVNGTLGVALALALGLGLTSGVPVAPRIVDPASGDDEGSGDAVDGEVDRWGPAGLHDHTAAATNPRAASLAMRIPGRGLVTEAVIGSSPWMPPAYRAETQPACRRGV
jgi:hypothetical protein